MATRKLVIRDAQMDAFREGLTRALRARLAAAIRISCAAETASWSDSSLVALIADETRRARQYGIIAEIDCLRYLELLFQHGSREGTPSVPEWAAEILNRPDLGAHRRLNLIAEHRLFSRASQRS